MNGFGFRIARLDEDGRGGYSFVETLAVLLFLGLMLGAGAARVHASIKNNQLRAATRRMFLLVRWMQSEAVRTRKKVGIVFNRAADGTYRFELYTDGDGDGIRTRDVTSGKDPKFAGPFFLSREYPGVRLGILERDRIPKVPPAGGVLRNRLDPVQFGSSDIISISPRGHSSTGTLYITDQSLRMMALVVYGPTVRIRIWTYRDGSGRWDR